MSMQLILDLILNPKFSIILSVCCVNAQVENIKSDQRFGAKHW